MKELILKMSVLLLLLKRELVKLSVFSKTDISEIVLTVKFLEELFSVSVCHVLVDHTAILSVYNEDNALSQDVMMTQHVIDHLLVLPIERLVI